MAINDGIDRFRRRHKIQEQVLRDSSLSFIQDSPSKTTVVLQKNEFEITALVVSSYKEGPNELLMFTLVNETDSSLDPEDQRNVFIGDYITYNNKTYLVFDDYEHPDFATYNKHKMLECNVTYGYNNKRIPAFYMGSRRKLETLNEGKLAQAISLAQAGDTPLIITKSQTDLRTRMRLMINGEAWMIDHIDRNTIQDIMFVSIHLDAVTTSDNVAESIAVVPTQPVVDDEILAAGDSVTIDTNFGFVRFDTEVVITAQSDTEVTFVVPYSVNELTVTTKDSEGELVTLTYEVA